MAGRGIFNFKKTKGKETKESPESEGTELKDVSVVYASLREEKKRESKPLSEMTPDEIKNQVDRHFNSYFRKEIVVAQNIRDALDALKNKFVTEKKIETDEIEKIAKYLHTSLADRSQSTAVIATINDYISTDNFSTFKTTILTSYYEKGSRFFSDNEDKITTRATALQNHVTEKTLHWKTECDEIINKKYKGAHVILSEITAVLSHLSTTWISQNDSLIRNGSLAKKQLDDELKKSAKEIESLYHLMKDIISINASSKDQLDIIINLIQITKANIQDYPTRSEKIIHHALAGLFNGLATDYLKNSPDFGVQLNKLAAKYSEKAGPVPTAKRAA